MLQLILGLLIYILIISLVFSKISFQSVLGIAIFTILTILLIVICIKQIQKMKRPIPALTAKEETEIEKLSHYTNKFNTLFKSLKYDNPFCKYKSDIYDLISRMLTKINQLDFLLLETFSPNDITYITYKDSFDKILKCYNNNFKKILKRMRVFDIVAYTKDPNDEVSNTYLKEIKALMDLNTEILEKVDKLISEIVSLDDISTFSLNSIDQLIEQTKNYQKLYDE